MSAVEQTGPPCVIDLDPRWAIDAVLFLTLSAAAAGAWHIRLSARAGRL